MNEENSVSLKVYLMEGNNKIEVRRFEVDQSVITSYDYMRERLQMSIPKIRGKIFKLLWTDSEGDEVTISSDDELMMALSEFKSNVCKFIVRIQSDDQEPEAHVSFSIPPMHNLHSSITSLAEDCPMFADLQSNQNCHSCQQPITGFRYKCLECVHYYQCGKCEHKNVHPDHLMLRLLNNSSLSTLITKGMRIVTNHFIQAGCAGMNAGAFIREKMSHCHKGFKEEKEKRGHHHHHRKFKKHGHGEKSYQQTDESKGQCPFNDNLLNNLENLLSLFGLQSMFQNLKPNETSTENPSTSFSPPSKPTATSTPPPEPTENIPMEEDFTETSTNESQAQQDKIKMAAELLAEMGFNGDIQWLTHLLEQFKGDIWKTIDHLTSKK